MPVDFDNDPVVLIIHGVQTSDNNDLRQHTHVAANLDNLLSNPDLHEDEPLPYTADIFKYEDVNDDAVSLVRRVLASMTGNSIAGWVVDKATDLVGDVLLALTEGSTYDLIKQQFGEKILAIHDTGRPVYIVAHSLGSFYAFELLNDWFDEFRFAKREKSEWPVHGLVTIGSPLGLELFERDAETLNRRKIGVNVRSRPRFPWKNYWDAQDPIVTGSLLGFPKRSKFPFRFDRQASKRKGWSIRSHEVNSGSSAHLFAHTAYWHSPTVGQGIVNMMYRDRENA
jgi:predicted alpha/beta hydrolase family esterase